MSSRGTAASPAEELLCLQTRLGHSHGSGQEMIHFFSRPALFCWVSFQLGSLEGGQH